MKTLYLFFVASLVFSVSVCNLACATETLQAGVASVDITPSEPVLLAGSPAPQKSASIGTRLSASLQK